MLNDYPQLRDQLSIPNLDGLAQSLLRQVRRYFSYDASTLRATITTKPERIFYELRVQVDSVTPAL